MIFDGFANKKCRENTDMGKYRRNRDTPQFTGGCHFMYP